MQLFPGEVLSGGGGVPIKRTSLAAVFNFLERLDDGIRCTHEETVAVVKP